MKTSSYFHVIWIYQQWWKLLRGPNRNPETELKDDKYTYVFSFLSFL